MTALRRAACRLQPALGWRSDGIPPAAAGILPLLGNPNQPVDAFALRAQRPQVHSSTEAPVSTASHQHCSTADPRCIPQATIRQRTHWGTIAASQEPAACFSIPRGTHGLQHSLRCLSASAVQLVSIRTAGQQRSASTSPCMVQWAGYSSSAAFVSEDGGGSFRTTAAGGEAGAAHGARSGAGFDSSGYGIYDDEDVGDGEGPAGGEGGVQRRRILDAALKHVKEKGWSVAALQAGARDLGLSPAAAGLVGGGGFDLIQHFQQRCDADMVAELAARPVGMGNMSLKERIAYAVQTRLRMIVPYIDAWPQALSIQAMPQNAPASLHRLAALIDDIWHAAGDTSSGYDWYTKRALLAGVYGTTELYMLTDFSPDYTDTWLALDRRIDDVIALGRSAGKAGAAFKSALGSLGELLGGLQHRHGRRSDG